MIFLNKNIKLLISVFLILTLSGCNLFKRNIKKNENPNVKEIEKIQEKVNSDNLIFQTFTAGFSGTYKDQKRQLPLKGIIKIKKDTFIWISIRPFLGIELARILLTPDSIKYINKANSQYFKENYEYLKKIYGFDINYKLAEDLFTNKIFSFPQEDNLILYTLKKDDNFYTLQKENTTNRFSYIHSLLINNEFNLIKNRLSLKNNTKSINFDYENFSEINSKQFPNKIIISTTNNNVTGKTTLELKSIKINTPIKAKFIIPGNYKRITF